MCESFFKLLPAGSVSSPAPGLDDSYELVTAACEDSGQLFTLDTGSAISLLPRSFAPPAQARRLGVGEPSTARGPGGEDIPLHGSAFHRFALLGEKFVHRFFIADVDNAILGLDFFRAYRLAVSPAPPHLVRVERLARPATSLGEPSAGRPRVGVLLPNNHRRTAPSFSVPTPKSMNKDMRPPVFKLRVQRIIEDFDDVFSGKLAVTKPRHGVQHEIVTEG